MVYNKEIVDVLFNSLSTGQSDLLNLETYPIPFKLNIANIKIEIYKEPKFNDMIMGQLVVSNTTIDSNYIKIWKTYAPGKFIISDFRKQKLDNNGHSLYYETYYKHGSFEMKALLRKLVELNAENTTLTEDDKKKLKNEYGDIKINDEYYAIIKICKVSNSVGWITPETHKVDINHDDHIDDIEDDSKNSEKEESFKLL